MATSPLTGAAWRKYHCYGRVNQPARSTQTLALTILSTSCQLLWLNELSRQIACCCLDKANSARNNESGLAWKHQIMNHGSQSSLQSIAKNATPWIKRKEALMKLQNGWVSEAICYMKEVRILKWWSLSNEALGKMTLWWQRLKQWSPEWGDGVWGMWPAGKGHQETFRDKGTCFLS